MARAAAASVVTIAPSEIMTRFISPALEHNANHYDDDVYSLEKSKLYSSRAQLLCISLSSSFSLSRAFLRVFYVVLQLYLHFQDISATS